MSREFAKTPGMEGGEGGGGRRQLRPRISCPQCNSRFTTTVELEGHICENISTTMTAMEPEEERDHSPPLTVLTATTTSTTVQPPTTTHSRRGRPPRTTGDEIMRTRAMHRQQEEQLSVKNETSVSSEAGFTGGSDLAVPSTSTGRTSGGRQHRCVACAKTFSSPGKLFQHMYSHTGERPFGCSQCSKAFSSKFKLMRHLLIHSSDRKHQCQVCERSFHRKDHLKNHSKVHSPDKKVYRCEKETCRKEYNSYLSYRKHVAIHAAEDGGLDCKICGRSFQTRDEILFHLKVHAGSRTVKNPSEKKFQCEHCERRFFTRKDVKRHLVVHTGKRDFLCQYCPQRFGRKDHLVRHIKKSHGGKNNKNKRDVAGTTTRESIPPSTSPIPGPSGLQTQRQRVTRRPAPPRHQQQQPQPEQHVTLLSTPQTPTNQPLLTPQTQIYQQPSQPPPYPHYKMFSETRELGIKIEEDDMEASLHTPHSSQVDPSEELNQFFQSADYSTNSSINLLNMSLIDSLDDNQLMQLMGSTGPTTDIPPHQSTPQPENPLVSSPPSVVSSSELPPITPPEQTLPCFDQAFSQLPPPPPPPPPPSSS